MCMFDTESADSQFVGVTERRGVKTGPQRPLVTRQAVN